MDRRMCHVVFAVSGTFQPNIYDFSKGALSNSIIWNEQCIANSFKLASPVNKTQNCSSMLELWTIFTGPEPQTFVLWLNTMPISLLCLFVCIYYLTVTKFSTQDTSSTLNIRRRWNRSDVRLTKAARVHFTALTLRIPTNEKWNEMLKEWNMKWI